jgi:hypothetical protein
MPLLPYNLPYSVQMCVRQRWLRASLKQIQSSQAELTTLQILGEERVSPGGIVSAASGVRLVSCQTKVTDHQPTRQTVW